MRKNWLILLIVGMIWLAPSICRSENCAWLNAATAGGLLGGEVTMKVTHTTDADTTCEFTINGKSPASSLMIEVHTMASVSHEFPAYLNPCEKTNTPLRGVGNEAVECTVVGAPDAMTEEIISRVRERAFLLKWKMTSSGGEMTAQAKIEMQEKFRNIAEQVAGSLF